MKENRNLSDEFKIKELLQPSEKQETLRMIGDI